MLAPLREHLADRSFWQHRALGFAVFGDPDSETVEIDVPVSLTTEVHVGDTTRSVHWWRRSMR